MDLKGPAVGADVELPSPPSLETEVKSFKFSLGFGKKGKKKKEKSPKLLSDVKAPEAKLDVEAPSLGFKGPNLTGNLDAEKPNLDASIVMPSVELDVQKPTLDLNID